MRSHLQSFRITRSTSAFVCPLTLHSCSSIFSLYSPILVCLCAICFPAQPPHTCPNSPTSKSHLASCHCLLSTGAYFPCFVILSSFWYLSLNCDTCMSSYDIRVFVPITFTYYFALLHFTLP